MLCNRYGFDIYLISICEGQSTQSLIPSDPGSIFRALTGTMTGIDTDYPQGHLELGT